MALDIKSLQDEVLRRVGRNLLLFQQIEGLLKFLLSNHKASGFPDDFKERQQKKADTINRNMFGLLVDKYCTEVLNDAGVEVPEDEGPPGWLSISFRIHSDADFVAAMRRDMKLMIEQRNELVHGFLPRWLPDTPEKLEETLAYLELQREKVLPMHEHLRATASRMQEGRRMQAELMASTDFQDQMELLWLQSSPLVSFLRDVSIQIQRKDGWCYLAHAGRLANRELPEDVSCLNERYGFKTLKKLLIGSEMFEIFDESLSEGKFRTLYKNKEGS